MEVGTTMGNRNQDIKCAEHITDCQQSVKYGVEAPQQQQQQQQQQEEEEEEEEEEEKVCLNFLKISPTFLFTLHFQFFVKPNHCPGATPTLHRPRTTLTMWSR